MDGTRFDSLARNLSTIGSRREAVKAAAVAGLGIGLAALGRGEAEAKKKRKKRCKRLGQFCKPGGKRKCCGDLACQVRNGNSSADCCRKVNAGCDVPEDCCEGGCIAVLPGQPKRCTVV